MLWTFPLKQQLLTFLSFALINFQMLTQMNNTLEEENRMLMEQMNKLLTQVLPHD